MNFAPLFGGVGDPAIGLTGLFPSAEQSGLTGRIIGAVDNYWGGAEFIYARASTTIPAFAPCILAPVYDSTRKLYEFEATPIPNTANLGKSVCVAQTDFAEDEYGWFMIAGVTPVASTANVTAGNPIGITGAGTLGANSAGKQILNVNTIESGAKTVVKAGSTASSGSKFLKVVDSDGWFPGVFLSGTGIAAGTRVVSIQKNGRLVELSLATTAAVNGNVTATYNNSTIFYNVIQLNRPFAQGAIT